MKWILTIAAVASVNALFPWWSLIFVMVVAGTLSENDKSAFTFGFLTTFAVWCGAAIMIYLSNQGVLAPRIGVVFHLPFWPLIFPVTGVIGGVVGGLSAWTGYNFQKLMIAESKKRNGTTTRSSH